MIFQRHNLAPFTAARLEEFLTALTNVGREPEAISDFRNRFTDFELLSDEIVEPFLEKFLEEGFNSVQGDDDSFLRLLVLYLRAMARGMWLAFDMRTRYDAWFFLRSEIERSRRTYINVSNWWIDDSLRIRLPPPREPLPVERAFEYLLKHHNRTSYCQNPDCSAPYYFAKRHTQRYCSTVCSQYGLKETKRRWWSEHGADWRASQKRLPKKSKKTGSKTAKKRKG